MRLPDLPRLLQERGFNRMKFLPASILIFAAAGWSQSVHCGTARWLKDHTVGGRFPNASGAFKLSAAAQPSRTLETEHFLIRYALRGFNRVKMVSGDEA